MNRFLRNIKYYSDYTNKIINSNDLLNEIQIIL